MTRILVFKAQYLFTYLTKFSEFSKNVTTELQFNIKWVLSAVRQGFIAKCFWNRPTCTSFKNFHQFKFFYCGTEVLRLLRFCTTVTTKVQYLNYWFWLKSKKFDWRFSWRNLKNHLVLTSSIQFISFLSTISMNLSPNYNFYKDNK